MKEIKLKIVCLSVALVVLTLAGSIALANNARMNVSVITQKRASIAPVNPEFVAWQKKVEKSGLEMYDDEGHALGHIPSPFDWSHLRSKEEAVSGGEGAPSSYDLRTYGLVTPVKDQGACGSCWSFGTYGSLESWLLKIPGENWDLSENHLKNYHGFDWGPCAGGNASISTAYLSRWSGPVSESDDPYNPWDDRPSPGGPCQKYLKNALWFFSDSDIKDALMTYGAMYVAFHWDSAYYNSSEYTYYYNGSDPNLNHAVTLIGWDDNKVVTGAPANGAWLLKNSWGTTWGNNGYFWISYFDSQALPYGVAFCNAVPPSSYITNYKYDPLGFVGAYGYGSTTAWGANVFIATANEFLVAVGFYAAADNTSYEIYVYDNFDGTSFSVLLGSTSGTVSQFGYHTITLPSPINLTKGNDFSIVIKFTTPGYNYPVPCEYVIAGYSSAASAGAGESYISSSGGSGTWYDLGAGVQANACIKGLTSNIKWQQLPDETENGIDIRCDRSDGITRTLADDFLCTTTGPITKITIWGSWFNDIKGTIKKIHLSFHSDDPCGPYGWSEPNDLLWEGDFTNFTETLYTTLYDPEWFWDPIAYDPPSIPMADRQIWQYDISIDPSKAFMQQGDPCNPIVYWLDAYVELEPDINNPMFGWKTSYKHWNDDAVWSYDDGLMWNELRYPPEHPYEPNSIDLAFAIITEEITPPPEVKPLIEHSKWSQPPIEIDPASEIPEYSGWNEISCLLYTGGASIQVYENYDAQGINSYYKPGTDLMADDIDLAGTDRTLAHYNFSIYAPIGTAPYTVTSELYTDSAGYPGTTIAGTACVHAVNSDGVVVLDCAPGSGAILPDNVWMVISFSDSNAGWLFGEAAELGSTDDLFAQYDGTTWSLYWFSGDPYAGFEANIWCETEESFDANLVADDFRCLGDMPITSIHWWGSHYGWEEPGVSPPQLPIGWKLCFWSNVPAVPAGPPVDGPLLSGSPNGMTRAVTSAKLPSSDQATPSGLSAPRTAVGGDMSQLLDCPPYTLFGQPPHGPNDPWYAVTSDAGSSPTYLVYENFSGVVHEICDIHFWGLDLLWDDGWYECDEDPMTFEIKFYQDAAGVPGAVVCSYTVTIARTPTGLQYAGCDLWEYSTTLSPCCTLTDGWVSIQGTSVSDPDCWFLWMSSPTGDGSSYQWDGETLNDLGVDMSLCLTGEPITFSYPEVLLWQIDVGANRVEVEQVGMDSYHGYYPNDVSYQYTLNLEPNEWFWQDDFNDATKDNIFWLSITAIYPNDVVVEYPWGWKTRPWSWMDDAVRFTLDDIPNPGFVLDPFDITPIKDPLYGESFDLAFELDTDPNYIKWEQHYTGIRHWKHYEDEVSMATSVVQPIFKRSQPPDPCGWDICLGCQWVTDDWLCTQTGPITDIHFWISWLGDKVGNVTSWDISIWSDMAGQPNIRLWNWNGQGNISTHFYGTGDQGWCCPSAVYNVPNDHNDIYQVDITNIQQPYTQQQGITYWLVIKANIPADPWLPVGWKTSVSSPPGVIQGNAALWSTDLLNWQQVNTAAPVGVRLHDMAFAITTEQQPYVKWVQKPDFSTTGVDVDATAIDPCQLLADDFNCVQTGPITNITIWGSWRDDILPPEYGRQVAFTLSIHEDIPANQSPTGYSMPGKLKWLHRFQPGQFTLQMVSNGTEGYYSPCEDYYDPNNHYIICSYSFDIDPAEAFVQEANNIYWLDLKAEPNLISPADPVPRFGWKTSKDHWNDDAVWRKEHMPISEPWRELIYPPEHPYHPNSIDLAFEITTQVQPELQLKSVVADDWPCDSNKPVTAAAWWGSYIGYRFQPCHGPFMELPKPPDYFLLSILTDVPAGVDPCFPFSHPNEIIWRYKAYDYDEVFVGYDKYPEGSLNVAICGAPSTPSWNNDVQAKLRATGQFNNVDIIDVSTTTPTLAQLLAYNAVLVYSDNIYANATALGNVMADYVDAGGGVVCAMFEIGYGSGPYPHPTAQMKGRWDTQGYYVLPRTAQHGPPRATLGTVHDPTHSIMQGVSSFDGGSMSPRPIWTTPIPPGATRIADWSDGAPLVVTKTIGGVPRADLGLYPPSSDSRSDFWVSSTDGALLMANALTWVAGGPAPAPTRHEPVFRYSVRLPKEDWFYQKEPNEIYWFSVVAVYERTVPNYDWGWTNHKHVFHDDAVTGYLDMSSEAPYWVWKVIYDQSGDSADMSFMLFTQQCLKHTAPEYADWAAWNKPKCWCYPRQCRGDIDGKKIMMKWVQAVDLTIFRSAFLKTDAQLALVPNGICADLDHKKILMKRVQAADLTIFRTYFLKPDAQVPLCDQPPVYTGPYNFWTSP